MGALLFTTRHCDAASAYMLDAGDEILPGNRAWHS